MNKNFKKPAGENSGDQNISTKKGFLLSLSGKKSSGETKSTINFASPQKITDAPQQKKQEAKQESKGSKQGRFGKNKAQKNDVQNDSKDQKRDGKNQPHDNRDNTSRDAKHNKNQHQDNQKNQSQKGNTDNRQKGQKQTRRNDRPQKGQKPNQQKQNNPNQQKNNAPERQNEGKTQNQNHKKNRDNRDNRHNQQKQNQPPKRTPLSALSGDMQSFEAEMAAHKTSAPLVKEPSLEEKYANAIPLADRIAAEDEKARHPVYSMSEETEKQEIVGIRFREGGKVYYFDPDGNQVPYGTSVVVETARGSEYGFTAISNRFIPKHSLVSPLKKIVRIATQMDTQKYNANKMLEKQAEEVFKEKVAQLGLAMNLIYVEYTFDNSKLLFYFTAETRIDFRELVKELAGVFRTRIELRQIGVRDEAKVLGCLGICGRSACCASFLGDFAQVSIKMAKDQNLSLNASKISGACGKLMCCLRYEDKVYEQENARTPKIGAIVETPEGKGTVTERNALRATVSVSLENTPDAPPKSFNRDDVSVVGFNASHESSDGRVDDNADELRDDE